MKVGNMYRVRFSGTITLWTKNGIVNGDGQRTVGKMVQGSIFQLVELKRGNSLESAYLKVIAGMKMGWFGCDDATVGHEDQWTKFFEELKADSTE